MDPYVSKMPNALLPISSISLIKLVEFILSYRGCAAGAWAISTKIRWENQEDYE